MTTIQDLQRTIARFIDRRRQRRQLQCEVAQLEALGSLDAVLADAGLVRAQIEPLMAGCTASGELLDKMLARLGIDAARLPVETQRDMSWTCTTCPDKRRCGKWLSQVEKTDFRAFCPNAAQLDGAMVQQSIVHGCPDDGAFNLSSDDLRRIRADVHRREVRALLDLAP